MVTITNRAAEKITDLILKEGKKFLRISVEGGGCAGFKYDMDLENEINDSDKIIRQNNAMIVIDSISFPYLENSTLDYEEDLTSEGFKINNPQANSECGCGNSFSI